MAFDPAVEAKIVSLGEDILAEVRSHRTGGHYRAFLQALLDQPELKIQLLRLVDVLPALENDSHLAEHLDLYLGSQDMPILWPSLARWGLRHARRGLPAHLIAATARTICRKMARQFIAGETIDEVEPVMRRFWQRGVGCSLDLLGEAGTGETSARMYQDAYVRLIPELSRRMRLWPPRSTAHAAGSAPQLHVSIKVSALYSQIRSVDPHGSVKAIKDRLRPILSAAREADAFILLDMEQFDFRTITLRVFQELLMESDFRQIQDIGIAMQAYLRDTPEVIKSLIAWAKERGTPVTVRLVRGAYWDYERTVAVQNAWSAPVWEHKSQTDQCYEESLNLLMKSFPVVRTAVATHNLRSICAAMVLAETNALSSADYEFQMLFGMADSFIEALAHRDIALRIYAPFGRLLPGMAYLVRRLMENSSNESFLKQSAEIGTNAAELLAAPAEVSVQAPHGAASAKPAFANLAPRRFAIPAQYEAFASALAPVRATAPLLVRPGIAGRVVDCPVVDHSLNPSHPEMVVGAIAGARAEHVTQAVAAAQATLGEWRETPVGRRAELLEGAAKLLAHSRDHLAAWEILEAGKPWLEADADVCEAVDHIRYAAFQARRLFAPVDLGVSGESDTYTYRPRGVAAIIAPWNFPLAIVAGMTAAALAAGNTVVIKPAPQTPVMAHWLVAALEKAGCPPGVVNFLPGDDQIGKALVEHPDIALIAFTGSEAVGRQIISAAAETPPDRKRFKHVIAEMGGKNAIIVDHDADLDEAVPEIIASAFGYAGQKCSACSRLIVLNAVYDRLMEKLVDAARSLRIGDAADPSTYVGPVIDAAAQDRIRGAVEQGRSAATLFFQAVLPEGLNGFFIPPAIFTDVSPASPLAQEEIFGPVLAVFRVDSMQEALALANNSRYGLTGGLMSRNPESIALIRDRMEVGNIYINRRITGAMVNRQPFGGVKLSGLGSKAGGPDYLLEFVLARVVTENTIRHGFVPPDA